MDCRRRQFSLGSSSIPGRLLGAILDQPIGGAWSIAPNEQASHERSYIDGTNVLQTEFHTASGTAHLTDFMPAMSEEEKRKMLLPEHELVRRVEGVQGGVELVVHFDPRPDYGRVKFAIHDNGVLG